MSRASTWTWRSASPIVLWLLLVVFMYGLFLVHPKLLGEASGHDTAIFIVALSLILTTNFAADHFAGRANTEKQRQRWIRWGWYAPRCVLVAVSIGMGFALVFVARDDGSLLGRFSTHARGIFQHSLMMSALIVAKWAEASNREILAPSTLLVGLPGARIAAVLEFLFTSEAYSRIVEPELAEMHREHFDALYQGRRWKARFALLRGHVQLVMVLLAETPIGRLLLGIMDRIARR